MARVTRLRTTAERRRNATSSRSIPTAQKRRRRLTTNSSRAHKLSRDFASLSKTEVTTEQLFAGGGARGTCARDGPTTTCPITAPRPKARSNVALYWSKPAQRLDPFLAQSSTQGPARRG